MVIWWDVGGRLDEKVSCKWLRADPFLEAFQIMWVFVNRLVFVSIVLHKPLAYL